MTFLNFALSETTEMLREAVKDFAKREIATLAEKIDRENFFPRDLWSKLGQLGVLGITIPEEYGGSGLSYLDHVVAMEEISRVSASVGLSYGAHSNLCANQIRLNGSTHQKKKYLPKLCKGEHIGALAMSEANAGSDVMSMALRAELKNDEYILDGAKMWITNGPEADIFVVYARTDKTLGSKGLSAFIVEKTFPGFSTAQKLDKLGMRGSSTCELIFKHCVVPCENILGKLHGGSKVLMNGLNYERVVLAAGPVGIMHACMDIVMPYVHDRKQFGKPIGEFEIMQAKLADMYTTLISSQSFLYAVANACDQQRVTRKDAAALILHTAEHATAMASQAIQCLGGNGYINDYPTGRLWRDAKLYEIGAGTSEIRRMLIGRELFEEHKTRVFR